jgi:hypothetical protein
LRWVNPQLSGEVHLYTPWQAPQSAVASSWWVPLKAGEGVPK